MSQYLTCRNPIHHHGTLTPMPMHGPARVRHVIKHRDCYPEAGIVETDNHWAMWKKAVAWLARIDEALAAWKAAGELDRFWADRENGGASWQN